MNRKPRYFRADWGVRKIKLIGADVCKLLWFYRPDSAAAAHQRDVVKRLVEECAALSLPLVVEPIWSPLENEDPATAAWRERRAEGIVASGIEASQLGIDMLKTEFPGYTDDDRGREQAVEACAALDAGIAVPWVLLSAGVGFDEFTLQCVSGWFRVVLCGSAGDLVVGRRAVQRAEPEEGLEGGHWGAAAVVTEDVLVEVDG